MTWGYPEGRCRRAAPGLLSRFDKGAIYTVAADTLFAPATVADATPTRPFPATGTRKVFVHCCTLNFRKGC